MKIFTRLFLLISFSTFAYSSYSQCASVGTDPNFAINNLTCSQQGPTTGGPGSGSARYFGPVASMAGSYVDAYLASNGSNISCAQFGYWNGSAQAGPYTNCLDQWGTSLAPAGATYIWVGTTRPNATWNGNSGQLYYRYSTPGVPVFSAGPTQVCTGATGQVFTIGATSSTTSYSWTATTASGTAAATLTAGGGNSLSATYSFSGSGTVNITATSSNNGQCTSSTTRTVQVDALSNAGTYAHTVLYTCDGQTRNAAGTVVTNSVSGAVGSVQWQFFTNVWNTWGTPSTSAPGFTCFPHNPTTTQAQRMRVVVTNGVCAAATGADVNITSVAQPAITNVTVGTSPICGQGTTILTANGVTGFNATTTWWTGPNGTGSNLGTGATKTVGPSVGTTYYARVTDICGGVSACVPSGSTPPADAAGVTVGIDATNPTITKPADIVITGSPNNGCNAAATFAAPGISDACATGSSAQADVVSTIPNLRLWTRADAGVVRDGSGAVAQWRDLSGNNNHFIQPVVGSRPELTANVINGNPVVRMSTTNNTSAAASKFLYTSNSLSSTNYTLFAITKMNGTNGAFGSTTNTNSRLISSYNTNWLFGNWGSGQNQLYCNNWISNPSVLADANVHMYTMTTTGSNTNFYDAGNTIVANSGIACSAPGQLATSGYIGGSEFSNGDVAEIIYYDRVLTTAERQIIEGYLAYKYNMQVPLASMQAFQTYAAGVSTRTFQAADAAGNTTTTTATATATLPYPGPVVTDPVAPACNTMTFTTSGMAPAGKRLTVNSADWLCVGGTGSCSAAGPWTSNLAVGSNWTIEAWVNLSTIPANAGGWNTLIRGESNHHIIIDRGGNGGSTTGQIGVYNGGFFGSGYNIIGSGLTGWHHITAIGSGGRTQFFVDGVRVGIANSQPTDKVVAIGNYQGGGQNFGQIDEVRIWNVALPHSTLGSFQTRNITNTHPNWNNLVGYYKMDGTLPVPNSASGTSACASCTGTMVGSGNVTADVNYYTYTWTASSGTVAPALVTTNESIVVTGAAQGTFNYTVRAAANGCNSAITSGSVVVPIIGVPSVNGSTTTTTASICGTGTITAVPGTNANTTRFYNGIPPSAGGGGALLATATSYAVTTSQTLYVTSYNSTTGCESSTYVTVVVTQTPTFSISQSNTNVSCFNGANGSATVSVVSGGTPPFTFTWSNGTVNTNNNPAPVSNTITGLAAGTYTVNVKDNGSCNNSTSFTITQPTQVVITGTTVSTYAGGFNISCNGGNNGSVIVNSVTGGTGAYTYTWSNLASSNSISSLVAGNYSVTVRDVNLCSATQSFTLSEPATLSTFITASYICSSGGVYVAAELTANPSGGAGPYTYVWSNGGATTQTIGSLANGVSRSVTVTDANSCQAVASFTTAFPPNGSSVNCNFVYVAANGDGSAGALASKDCPATFERGLLIFAANPTRNVMLMQAGDYGVYNATIAIPSNLTIDGDYEVVGGDWRKNSALATNIHINPSLTTATVSSVTVGNYIGLNASSASGFTLKDVNVYVKAGNNGSGNLFNSGTATGVTSSRGNSIYGFYANNATAYSLTRCLFITGAAPKGANGSTPSAGGGGGGGSGGGGGGTGYDCDNGSGGAGGQPGSAGASGGFGGGQGNNNGCNTVGCDANGGNGGNGGAGTGGVNGSGFSAGSLTAPSPSQAFYLPGGQSLSGNNGAGGGGGGGGGGAAVGSCCTCGCGSGNANGGSGGNGGAGGQGGTGGFGGGGSFPVYLVGGTGTITDVQTNAGAGGAGGDGASGSSGLSGNGGAGGNAMSRCSVTYFGGTGGNGGAGGAGGRGQDGAAGASQGFVSLSSGPAQNGTTIPAPTTVTALQYQGCANSVITITKNTGTWTLPAGAQFVNDVSTSVASSGTSSNTASIYFTSPATTGLKDLAVGAGAANTFKGFVNIRTSTRTLPSINAITTPICPNTSISIGTGATADAYAWSVQLISSPNSASSPGANLLSNTTAQNPGLLTLTAPGTYQVKLQAFDFCCGWTIPVYATVVVSSAPSVPGAISGDQTVCAGATKTYSISPVGGAASYVWTIPSGASIQGANNGTSISVLYPVSAGSGNITVLAQNGCVPPQQSTTSSIPITISGLPSVSISPQATALCAGTAIQMTGGASGGSGTYTNYTWTPAGSINGSNTTQVVNTTALTTTVTYTLQVTDNLGCIGSTNQIINVNPQPVAASVTPTPAAGTICEGTSVSAAIGTGSGGIGTITNVVEFTTNTGGAWNAYTSNNSIASNGLSGANVIQIRSILSATGFGCNPATINASWSVNQAATVSTPASQTVCSSGTPLNGTTIGGSATSVTWSAASGTFSNANALNPTYDPSIMSGGPITLTVTTNDPDGAGPCVAASATKDIMISTEATANAGPDLATCVNTAITIPNGNASVTGVTLGDFEWTEVSPGSLSGELTLTPSYTPISTQGGTTVTLRLTAYPPSAPCPAVFDEVNIQVYGLPTTANAGSDIFDCSEDLVVTLAGNTPTTGTGAWSGPVAATFTPGNTPNSTASVTTKGTYTYTWTITSGTCTPSADQVNVSYNNPLPITMINGASGSCFVNDNVWHHIFDANGNVILSINSNGEDLGNVTASVNIGPPLEVNNNQNLGCPSPNLSQMAFMGRNFSIVPNNQPITDNVDVRFYFTAQELAELEAKALANNVNNNPCDDDDDVSSIAVVGVSKYNTGSGPGGAGVFIAQSPSGNGNAYNANYIEISTPSFSDFYLHGNSNNAPLPVELISFTATPINNQYIRLDWATALEINNDGFELQRSTDAQTWTNIAWIEGNDNSTITQFYNHNDMQVAINITYYYRLKQIDNDGQFEYSNIVNAKLNGSGNGFDVLDFIPNPTVDQTTLLISSGTAQEITVSFYNAIGQVVQTNKHELSAGMNQVVFDVNLLAAGTYMATVTSGNEVRTKRLVITR